MSAPVISAASSILGYRRYEYWEFQPAASNGPVIWSAVGLPDGILVETWGARSATGVASTDIVTSTGHGYANGDRVWFSALSGGSGLSTGTVYFVRDRTDDTFKLASGAGGDALDFSSDISSGTVRKVSSGKISGRGNVPGAYAVTLSATNLASETGSQQFFIGITSESVPLSGDDPAGVAATDWVVDVATREVTTGQQVDIPTQAGLPAGAAAQSGAGGSGGAKALAYWKEGDVVMLSLRFAKNGAVVDMQPVTIKLALKQYDPEAVLIEAEDFEQVGSGVEARYHLPVALTGAKLAAALSDNEDDAGTGFVALAEIEWTISVTHDSAPLTLRTSTQTFAVLIERDLLDN